MTSGWMLAVQLLVVSIVLATAQAITCGDGKLCPSDQPCCSQYGQCGVGAYCLGGCNPAHSFELSSCVPSPICQSAEYTFDQDLSSVVGVTEYLGNASDKAWVSTGTPLPYQSQVLLTMAEGTVGTMLSSTFYVWYGRVSAQILTSGGRGVVTAFLLYADSQDEIDFEFVGVELESSQTSFYSQGDSGGSTENATGLTNVRENVHDYEIDWTPDNITWSIDGGVARTLLREDTWSSLDNRFLFPQTPAREQVNLWPAGLESNGQSTIDWAGGLIDWDSDYMSPTADPRYYYATVNSVSVLCYSPPGGATIQGSTSYVYSSRDMTNDTIEITNRETVIDSFSATGNNSSGNDTSTNTIPPVSPTSAPSSSSSSVPSSSATDFTQGGGNNASNSGMSTSAKIGVGVGVPLAVIAIAVAAFFILRRHRRSKRSKQAPSTDRSSNEDKPELPAQYDPTVAGPVKPKAQLATQTTIRRKPANELPAAYLPPELNGDGGSNEPEIHGGEGYVPPSLRVYEIGRGTLGPEAQMDGKSREGAPLGGEVESGTVNDDRHISDALQSPGGSTAGELAEEADVLVQELGLVSMRKKTLMADASAKGVKPEELPGRKGQECMELMARENRARERLDGIERDRGG